MTQEERDDRSNLAEWEEAVRNIKPLECTDDERRELAEYEATLKQFNRDAVRRQMIPFR